MANYSKAILATIQKVRETYQIITSDRKRAIAIPATWTNSAPLLEHLQKINDSEQNKLRLQFELTRFTNAVLSNKFVWTASTDTLWEIYEQVLSSTNADITEDILTQWQNAKTALELAYKTSLDGIDFPTTVVDDNPSWNRVTLSERQIEELNNNALADRRFADIYKAVQVGDLEENLNIKEVSFEMASVHIDRPWFKEDILESRHWKLRDGAKINGKSYLSSNDESSTFQGALPAYPVAFILVRNFSVVFQAETQEVDDVVQDQIDNGFIINFGPLLLQNFKSKLIAGIPIHTVQGIHAPIRTINHVKLPFILSQLPVKDRLKFRHETDFFKTEVVTVKPEVMANILKHSNTFKNYTTTFKPFPTSNSVGAIPRGGGNPNRVACNVIVQNTSGKALQDANISLLLIGNNGETTTQLVKTDSTGKVNVQLHPNQKYQVLVTKPGYKKHTQDFMTSSNAENSLTVKLKRAEARTEQDQITDIQLLAVVYQKLDEAPRPIENFVSAEIM